MKIASLILLGWSTLAVATTPAALAQTQSAAEPLRQQMTLGADVSIAEMRLRLSEDKLIEPNGANARDTLRVLLRVAPDGPEVRQLTRDLFERLLRKGRAAMQAQAYERSSQLLQVARDIGASLNDPALEQAESELSRARAGELEPARSSGIVDWIAMRCSTRPNTSDPACSRSTR
jgi:hypothetical protein